MSSSIAGEIINTLEELQRMHQLCFELLEQLNVACQHIQKNYPNAPNNDNLASLLSKALALLEEMNSKLPSDESLQGDKSDKDLTEPWYRA